MKKATIETIFQQIETWNRKRNQAPEQQINKLSAEHAKNIGLPTLQHLYTALDQVSGNMKKTEVEEMIQQFIHIASGEATIRLQTATKNLTVMTPGINIMSKSVLETK